MVTLTLPRFVPFIFLLIFSEIINLSKAKGNSVDTEFQSSPQFCVKLNTMFLTIHKVESFSTKESRLKRSWDSNFQSQPITIQWTENAMHRTLF